MLEALYDIIGGASLGGGESAGMGRRGLVVGYRGSLRSAVESSTYEGPLSSFPRTYTDNVIFFINPIVHIYSVY